MKIVIKDIPIYFGYFRIVITNDLNKSFRKVVKNAKERNGFKANNYAAFVHNDKTKKGINRHTVFLKPNCSHSIIAHETVHLVNAIYVDSGIQLDRHNDEPQAYLTGWFVREIYKALNQDKK